MPVRKGNVPFSIDQLETGAKIGSRLQTGAPPVLVLAGDASLVKEVTAFMEWGVGDYTIYLIIRWAEGEYRVTREVIGVSVYCIHPTDAFGIGLRFTNRLSYDHAA